MWRKQGSGWSITENPDQYANYHQILEQTSKVLIMLRKLLLILYQRQKYQALVLSVSLLNLTSKNGRQANGTLYLH